MFARHPPAISTSLLKILCAIGRVLFRGVAAKVGFKLKEGLQVITFGDISVYEKNGQYQLVARQLLPKGFGALQLARGIETAPRQEGLFDSSRSDRSPPWPSALGCHITYGCGRSVISSYINRAFPTCRSSSIRRVQGEGAAAENAAAIDRLQPLHASGRLPLDVRHCERAAARSKIVGLQ